MSCSIKDRSESSISEVVSLLIGGSNKFISRRPGEVEMTIDNQKFKSKGQLYKIAVKKAIEVEDWAKNEFGEKFSRGWIDIDKTLRDSIIMRVKVPQLLIKAWMVQDQTKSLEEANNEIESGIGNDFYMGDDLLRLQDEQSEDDFYSEFEEVFGPTLSERIESSWDYDRSQESNVNLSNELTNKLKNKKRDC